MVEPPDTTSGEWVRSLCRAAGFEPDIRYTTTDLLVHRQLVADGHAVGILPDLLGEAASANFNPHSPAKVDTANRNRGPLLLVTGGRDHTVPEAVTRATLKQYCHSDAVTDLIEFPDRGHSLTVDNGWREVADAALVWLHKQGL